MAFESYNQSSNFVGKDGLRWWVGQIEKNDINAKNSNRFKVRIVGHHLADCEKQSTENLPWANCVAPTTAPFSAGGSVTTPLNYGDWVIGFFMDSGMAQQPYILGSIGSIRNTTGNTDAALDSFLASSQEGCRAFKNFKPGPIAGSAQVVVGNSKAEIQSAVNGTTGTAAAPPGSASNPKCGPGQPCAVSYGPTAGTAGTPLNEAGKKCTIISQADCPTGKTASMIQIVLSEMFKAISESGGQVGSYLTSKVTGYARDAESFIMGYVNKIMAIIFQGYAWVKGKLYNLIQQGAEFLINSLLSLVSDKNQPKDKKPPYDPKNPTKILDKIQKFLEDQLKLIGCSIESLYDRILAFLTDYLFGLIGDFWSDALCGIEQMVNSLMNALQKFISDAINAIIEPLLSILGAIAAPLDEFFGTIFEIMSFLGIQCTGLPAECKEVIEDCGEGPKTKAKGAIDAALDNLLAKLAGDTKPSPAIASCADALTPVVPPLNVAITGGTTTPTTPSTPGSRGGGEVGDPDIGGGGTTTDPTLDILIDPQSVVKDIGNNHTFQVVASTSDNSGILYQWQKFDSSASKFVDISSATKSTYDLTNLTTADDSDTYRCVCTSSTGKTVPTSVTSVEAYIYINPAGVTPTSPITAFRNSGYATLTFTSDINISTVIQNTFTTNYSNKNTTNTSKSTFTITGTATVTYTPIPISATAIPNATYSLSAYPLLVSPGDFVELTLKTTNIVDNTVLDFYIFGTSLKLSDVTNNTLSGSFKVISNKAIVKLGISNPVSFSQKELVFAALKNGAAATQFAIEGNPIAPTPSLCPAGEVYDLLRKKCVTTPPVNPPIACPPIVSNTGQIISIPICKPGKSYIAPPAIYIQGNGAGYGASAIAEMDDDGFIKEIKVVRPGRGYPPNPPDNLDCVITGFTMIKTGFGYDVPPAVFVGDDLDVAEAIISNGSVVGIKVLDKSKTYTENPVITIISISQGIGAIAIANITCLDKKDGRDLAEIVGPTPVGEYIDCP
jgi:hypothetical protein